MLGGVILLQVLLGILAGGETLRVVRGDKRLGVTNCDIWQVVTPARSYRLFGLHRPFRIATCHASQSVTEVFFNPDTRRAAPIPTDLKEIIQRMLSFEPIMALSVTSRRANKRSLTASFLNVSSKEFDAL